MPPLGNEFLLLKIFLSEVLSFFTYPFSKNSTHGTTYQFSDLIGLVTFKIFDEDEKLFFSKFLCGIFLFFGNLLWIWLSYFWPNWIMFWVFISESEYSANGIVPRSYLLRLFFRSSSCELFEAINIPPPKVLVLTILGKF